jgi:phosphohistidine swiveling domain-containing protein
VSTELQRPLDGQGTPVAVVGGKGAWLDRLVSAGFAVPRCAAITTDAYRLAATSPGVAALISELVAGPLPDPDDYEREQERIDKVFLSAEVPDEVSDAIRDAGTWCRATGTLLAARSSATAEDMSTTSFAGQYRSFLELADEADVEHAVRLVWASLWYPAPRSYRRYHHIDESTLAMAVVIMEMVPAERAGVAFTVDPGGTPDVVRVETVEGLGEQLVSGRVTPTVSLVPRPAPGVTTTAPNGHLAARVAALALAVEDAFGAPQDIEWASTGNQLVVLQARPITTVGAAPDGDGFDTVTTDDVHWTTAGIAEMLPGTMGPLEWETTGLLLEEAFRRLFDDLQVLDHIDDEARIVGRFRGRAALNLGLIEQMAVALPGGSPTEVEQQYFGRSAGEHPVTENAPRRGRLRTARHDLTVLRVERQANREAETVIEAIDELLQTPTPLGMTTAELLVRRRRLLDLAARAMAAETVVAASAVAAYRRLEGWLRRRFERVEAERWAQRITSGAGPVPWWQTALETGADAPEIVATITDKDSWTDAERQLRATDLGMRFCTNLAEAARRAGSTAIFGGPTWSEQPDQVWATVRAACARGNSPSSVGPTVAADSWAELVTSIQALPDWNRTRALTLQLIDVRLSMLRRLVDDAVELLDRRERTKAAVLALGGEVRRIDLEIGRRLVDRGLLEVATDVRLLGEAELLAAAASSASSASSAPSLAELGRRRRWLQRCELEPGLPHRFRGCPAAPVATTPHGQSQFHGWGAGPGIQTGPACVLRHPSGELQRGDVLVAPTTDASWSPMFLLAGAIVVEQGGPLSHAAIVARELGIPAVLNVPGIVAALDGRRHTVTVDGDRGVVVIDPTDPGDLDEVEP